MELPETSATTISFDSFEPYEPSVYVGEPENNAPKPDAQWDFEPWDKAAQQSDWRTWKPVPGSTIVYEKDRFGRAIRPKVVVVDFAPAR